MNRGNGGFQHTGNRTGPAVAVDNLAGLLVHEKKHAIIATTKQAESCDNRFCETRNFRLQGGMTNDEIKEALVAKGLKDKDLAAYLGVEADKVSKSLNGKRRWQAQEILAIAEYLAPNPQESKEVEPPEVREVAVLMHRMDLTGREIVRDVARRLAKDGPE